MPSPTTRPSALDPEHFLRDLASGPTELDSAERLRGATIARSQAVDSLLGGLDLRWMDELRAALDRADGGMASREDVAEALEAAAHGLRWTPSF